MVAAEGKDTGSVTLATYVAYAKAGLSPIQLAIVVDSIPLTGGGVLVYVFILSLFVFALSIKGFSDYFLSYWIQHGLS